MTVHAFSSLLTHAHVLKCMHIHSYTHIVCMYAVLQDDFNNTSSQVIIISELMLAAILVQHPGEIFATDLFF